MNMQSAFEQWWDTTTKPPAPNTFRKWEESCRLAWDAAIQAYRDSLAGEVVLPEPDMVIDYETEYQSGTYYTHSSGQLRQAIADALAKQVLGKHDLRPIDRDDTEHGVSYYKASEVDALLAKQVQLNQAGNLDYAQRLDIVTNWFSEEDDITRAMQMLTDFEQTSAAAPDPKGGA